MSILPKDSWRNLRELGLPVAKDALTNLLDTLDYYVILAEDAVAKANALEERLRYGEPKKLHEPMTLNEKAATFIGWYPTKRCGFKFLSGRCQCGAPMPQICPEGGTPHDEFAPDMTDPRNYMHALSGLQKHQLEYALCGGIEGDTVVSVFDLRKDPDDPDRRPVMVSRDSAGDAVVAGLAMLFDLYPLYRVNAEIKENIG